MQLSTLSRPDPVIAWRERDSLAAVDTDECLAAHSAVSLRAADGCIPRDDAQAGRREPDVRRRAAAFLGHQTAGSPPSESPDRPVP
jgi:hypothetical protein